MQVGEQTRPPQADQEKRRTPTDAGRFTHFPAVDQALTSEELDSKLSCSGAGKEELTDLKRGQVAVVVKDLEDTSITLGQVSEKSGGLFLGEGRGGVLWNRAKDEWTNWNRSPSWSERRSNVNMRRNSLGLRAALRSLKRRSGKRSTRNES